MSEMSCDEIRDLLALYAGGEAREDERAEVEAHVGLCAACARELDQYREMRANLSPLRELEAPAGTWKSLWHGLRAELFPRPAPRALLFLDTAVRYAAVLMVGLAIGVAIHFFQRAPERSPLAAPPRMNVEPTVVSGPGALRAIPGGTAFPLAPSPRPQPPRAPSESSNYLPRVEAIPASGERDF